MTGRPLMQIGDQNVSVQEARDILAKEGSVPPDLQRIAPELLDGLRRMRPPVAHPGERQLDLPEHVWANALAAPLPFAPDLRIHALYGIGVPTEFSGAFKKTGDDVERPMYSVDKAAPDTFFGFHLGPGDYSVPLHSLGLMCVKGWKDHARNPARVPCTTKEYQDKKPSTVSMRGGPASGDHIDLLGNQELLEDVLRLAAGGEVEGRILSNIEDMAERWDDV